jgi:hypothetical protein
MGITATWGSTLEERARPYPCDGLVEGADRELYRAIDVDAPAEVTFRWLCQLRVAPYSYDWIDNFGHRSPRELTPGLDELAVGQRVMRIFRLESFEAGRHLTLVLDDAAGRRLFGDLAVTYEVLPRGPSSRIVVKMVVLRPRGALRVLSSLLPAGDLVMMRKQLRTLKKLAERAGQAGSAQKRHPSAS